MGFYSEVPEDLKELQQGDILFPVPFVGFTIARAQVLEADAEKPIETDLRTRDAMPLTARLVVSLRQSVGIIANQSCDLSSDVGRGRTILVARVVPAAERVKAFEPAKIPEFANPGKRPSLFFLPASATAKFSLPPSVADLLEVATLPPSDHEHLPAPTAPGSVWTRSRRPPPRGR